SWVNNDLEIIKPLTFMNKSGEAVKYAYKKHNLKPDQLMVIHDDLDIKLGAYKISINASAAGHNGVQNIIDKVGSQKFKRVRIGIEGPEKKKERVIPGEIFVLQNFTSQELETIIKISKKIINEIS
ncbi:MAG: peptidyl-tRNA hydrolase, partial [Candidatus Moranbacteria bacterium]|nr:peptidyl-tRNA hydrolase [Candidatus Moranbacteria bacterium]